MSAEFRVVVVNDYAYISGGASQVAISTCKALAKTGVPITFFAGVGPADPEMEALGIEVVCLNLPRYSESGRKRAMLEMLWDNHAAEAFEGILTRHSDEKLIVHIHAFPDSLSASVPDVARRLKIPTAFTIHEYTLGCPYQGFYDTVRQRICPLTGLSASCWMTRCSPSYARKLYRNMRMLIQRRKAHIPWPEANFFTISPFSRRVIEPYLPSECRIFDIPNPFTFERLPAADPASNQSFLFLGRITVEKGPDIFALAAADAEVEAVFVGEGDYSGRVAQINPQAKMLGWREHAEVSGILRNSRALVFPSRWYEGQPLVVQEALSNGIPVICADASAAVDAVADGETGFHFPTGDVAALAARLRTIKNDDAIVARLGKEAYHRSWADPQTMDVHLKKLMAAYRAILD